MFVVSYLINPLCLRHDAVQLPQQEHDIALLEAYTYEAYKVHAPWLSKTVLPLRMGAGDLFCEVVCLNMGKAYCKTSRGQAT